jgi:heme exporter protein D
MLAMPAMTMLLLLLLLLGECVQRRSAHKEHRRRQVRDEALRKMAAEGGLYLKGSEDEDGLSDQTESERREVRKNRGLGFEVRPDGAS